MFSQRDRLLLAFANLASYGIAARPALPAGREGGHAALTRELRARHPHGMGSYAFWTARNDTVFDRAGEPTGDLPLHCSDAETLRAVSAACRQAGLDALRDDGNRTLVLAASRTSGRLDLDLQAAA